MKRRVLLAASTILVTMVGPGCEDAAKKPAQAHVPGTPAAAAHVAAPSPTWQSQTAQQPAPPLAPLPLTDPKRQPPKSLLAPLPDGKNYLMQKVQEKFASGEQNFKAGRLEAARKDFDDAVDWMLESGYDPDGDAVLSALFHHVVDSVYAYELQAFRGGEGFTQAAAVRAPARGASGNSWLIAGSSTGCAVLGGSMSGRIRKKPRGRRRSTCATFMDCSATGIWPWRRTTAAPATCRRPSSAPAMRIFGSCTSARSCPAKQKTMCPSLSR